MLGCELEVLAKECNRLEDAAGEMADDTDKLRASSAREAAYERMNDHLHTPPKAEELPERLQLLCDFANIEDENNIGDAFVHPVVRAITLHFMLAYDHPFCDGNGRTARALFYWSMLKHGYWPMEFISISRIIKLAPAQYGRAFLYTETDEKDLTYFLIHQLGVIHKAVDALHAFLDEKCRELAELKKCLLTTPS